MRRKLIMWCYVFTLFCLMGCGGGSDSNDSKASLLKGMGWYIDNTAPDYYNDGSTCSMNVFLYYQESVAFNEIESFKISAPNGWVWQFTTSNMRTGTNGAGTPYVGGRLIFGGNPQAFPLAGIWTAEIKLKSGSISSFQRTIHEPGSAAAATYKYLFTKEDWTQTDPAQYIAALGRFPSQGYTVNFSAADGGKITTSDLASVRADFLAAEPAAFNMYCWLYDADNNYLGYTYTEYSILDHSKTSLIGGDGELTILPASSIFASGTADLSKVKYIRFVYADGAQFAPAYSTYDYRSISSLIAVN